MIAGLVAAVFAFASFDAMAAAKGDQTLVRSRTLHFTADSLTNPVAAQKLYRRIRMTARTVCHLQSDDVSNGRALAACVQQATGAAVASIDSVELTALHRARVAGEVSFAG
jgi:UrcA family protein